MPKKSTHKLDAYLSRLGKEPDHKIAVEAGVSRSLIISFRKKHDIPAYEGYKFGPENPPPAARAAAAKGASTASAPKAAAPKAPKAPAPKATGKAPAAKPASASVAPAPAPVAAEGSFRGRKSALDAFLEMLGRLPDAEVAKLAHVTPENVRTYRTRRGIAASWPEAGKPRQPRAAAPGKAASAPAPAAPPVTAGARSVFSVSVDVGGTAKTYAIVAANLNDGVLTANALVHAKHANGHVKGIAFVAELLG